MHLNYKLWAWTFFIVFVLSFALNLHSQVTIERLRTTYAATDVELDQAERLLKTAAEKFEKRVAEERTREASAIVLLLDAHAELLRAEQAANGLRAQVLPAAEAPKHFVNAIHSFKAWHRLANVESVEGLSVPALSDRLRRLMEARGYRFRSINRTTWRVIPPA